jgi:hypothetical protein
MEFGERNQVNRWERAYSCQSDPLRVARGPQARADLFEVGVVISGVRDQFPCAFGHLAQQCTDGVGIERARSGNGDGAVSADEVGARQDAPEERPQLPQGDYLGSAHKRSARRYPNRPLRFERIADGPDAGLSRRAQHGLEHRREHVRVLVSVDMSEPQAGVLEQGDLGSSLGFNFSGTDAAGEEAGAKSGQGDGEAAGLFLDKGRNVLGREDGPAVDEHNMAADAQCWRGVRQANRLVSRAGTRHQRGAGEYAGVVQFDDGPVHPGGQPEVVGINNEAAHRVSLSIAAGGRR